MGLYQCIVREKQMNASQRYASQTVLDEIGVEGQQRLAQARVLVVGAGGLGSPVLLYLTAAGVGQKMHGGRIGIIDDDQVDTSNLQRQILFREKDLGQAKAMAGAHHLEGLNSSTQIHPIKDRLRIENVLEIFSDYDIIVDGADNFATRFLINDACVLLGKPNVHGGVDRFRGQATVFSLPEGPCYRCLFDEPPPPGTALNCAEAGVLGVVPGIIGVIQATEAESWTKDAKTELQEWLQARRLPVPTYRIAATRGEKHAQTFEVECLVPTLALTERGEGRSRRAAEQEAARRLLGVLKASDRPGGPLRS